MASDFPIMSTIILVLFKYLAERVYKMCHIAWPFHHLNMSGISTIERMILETSCKLMKWCPSNFTHSFIFLYSSKKQRLRRYSNISEVVQINLSHSMTNMSRIPTFEWMILETSCKLIKWCPSNLNILLFFYIHQKSNDLGDIDKYVT